MTTLPVARLYRMGALRRERWLPMRALGWCSWALWLTVRHLDHPLVADRPVRMMRRMWTWQLWRRLVKKAALVRLPEGTLLLCPPWSGLASAWIAVGFHEYAEAMFILDYLRPGDVFIDIGANLGFYSLIAARRGAYSIAIEPSWRARRVIEINRDFNGLGDQLRIVPFALADRPGVAHFTTHLDNSNHLMGDDDTDQATSESVDVRTLDSVGREYVPGERSPALLKIDAEGFDLQVLQGGERLIEQTRPALLVEIWAGGHAIRDWLEARGYGVHAYDPASRQLLAVPRSFAGQGMFIAIHGDDLASARSRVLGATRPPLHHPRVRWRGTAPGSGR